MSEVAEKHVLADYVRILARGKNASRSMTQEEAQFTMRHMLDGNFHPEQLGAILMLMRVKEESAEELAGFASAINQSWPEQTPFDLVWPSYAGKRRQPFWCLLSALLLNSMGYRILFHGSLAHTEGRVYLHELFTELGLPAVRLSELHTAPSLCYLPCDELNPQLQHWLSLKSILGVRSPINTILKTLSPVGVPSVQGVFHPNYAAIHTGAAELTGANMLVIKGEGGEFEVNPERAVKAAWHLNGASGTLVIPNTQSHYADKPDSTRTDLLRQHWRGELNSEYARLAVIHTAALALVAIRKQANIDDFIVECTQAWEARDLSRL